MTRYLIVTESIPTESAQASKNDNIEYARDQVRGAIEELRAAKNAPLVTERKRQIEVEPGHPDYNKASDTPDLGLYMGALVSENQIKFSPWMNLLEGGTWPENMGEVIT